MATPIPRPQRVKRGWQIRFTDESGHRRKETFLHYQEADLALRQHLARIREVQAGLRSPTPPVKLFGELADIYLANRTVQKRSAVHDQSIIRRHLRPFFGAMALKDIGTADVDRFVCERLHLDIKTVSNLVTLLITMLNYAVDLGWLVKAPRIRKPKVRIFDKDFRYLRTREEITRFLVAAKEEGPLAYALYATAVFTGLRQGELAALQRGHVDLQKRLITVQGSFNGPTKAGDVRYVPIMDALLPILREWLLLTPGSILFPSGAGTMQVKSGRVFQESFHRVLDRAGFPVEKKGSRTRRHIRFHDLRHTFATQWVMNGGDMFRLQKILGHKTVAMTMRYAHLAPAAFAGDYGRMGAAPTPMGVVVPINAAASG